MNPSTDTAALKLGWALAALIVLVMVAMLPWQSWPDYGALVAALGEPGARLRWLLGDITEVVFYKHELPALGLLGGAALAFWAQRCGWRWGGFPIAYGTGLWAWLVLASLLGLLLSHGLWGWTLKPGEWQPTFVAFVSLPAAMVLLYGGGWKVAWLGAWGGALLVAPACLVLVNLVCNPLGWPAVIGNVLGMAMGSALAFAICRRWPELVSEAIVAEPPAAAVKVQACRGLGWTVRRVLADFSEAPFFGNELAGMGLLLGALLAWAINPASTAYGSELLLHIVAGQVLASLLGICLWRRKWQALGWYPTYIPIVSVVPAAVLVVGGAWWVVIASAVLGAVMAPPLAVWISDRLPAFMHRYIGNLLSMAVTTGAVVGVLGLFT